VDFGNFSFNSNITWSLSGADFVGIDLTGVSGGSSFFANLKSAWDSLPDAPKLSFDWADFSGLDLSGWSGAENDTFQFGSFKGVSFSNMTLPTLLTGNWDFTGLDLSLGDWSGFSIGDGSSSTKLDFGLSNLSGADIAGALNLVASAAGAFYNALTAFDGFSASFLTSLGMNEVVLDDVFGTPLSGPAFAFTPSFTPNGTESVSLGFRIQVNQDLMSRLEFAIGLDDLGMEALTALGSFDVSGTAMARLVVALDLEAMVEVPLVKQGTLVGDLPVPAFSDTEVLVGLNRFDVGASAGLYGFTATLEVVNLGTVSVLDGELALSVAGRVGLADPNGDGKLSLSEVSALKAADPTGWYRNVITLTPAARFDAGFRVEVDPGITIGGSSFTDMLGNLIVNVNSDQLFITDDNGNARFNSPAVTLDVALTTTQRDQLLSVLQQFKSVGDSALDSDFLNTVIPGLNKTLSELFTVSGDQSVLSALFNLQTAAEQYFQSSTLGFGGTTGTETATIRGLAAALNEALAKASAMPFSPVQSDWSGAQLAWTDFSGMDLRGFSFVGADLRGANFTGADLTGVNFAGANLTGATFATYGADGKVTSGAVLRDANLRGATLSGLLLAGLDLRGAVFADTDLSGVDLSAASLVAANFSRATVSNTTRVAGALFTGELAKELKAAGDYLSAVRLDPASGLADLSGYMLDGFDLSGLDLSKVDFTNASLAGASLREAVLDVTRLGGATLDQALIYKAQFENAAADVQALLDDAIAFGTELSGLDFSDPASLLDQLKSIGASAGSLSADLSGFDLSGFDLSGIDFSNLNLAGARLNGAEFAGANLATAILDDTTSFIAASLADVQGLPDVLKGNFERANLAGADLTGKVLDSLNMAGADLTGAILTDASLTLANLRGAVLANIEAAGADAAAQLDALTSALNGAVYDELTRFNAASAETLKAAMAPFALDDVFTEGAEGPLFSFLGGLQINADGITLGLNLQVNIDTEVSREFMLDTADLPAEAQQLAPEFNLSAMASARLVAALNADLGVDIASGSEGTFSLDSESWLRLNRFDAGVRLAVSELDASLSVAGLANVSVSEGVIDLRAAAQLTLTDPNNDDGLNRITSTERGSTAWADLVELQTTSNLRGSLLLNAEGAGFNLNDFGLPTLIFRAPELISRNAETGDWEVASPDLFLDVRITETLRDSILELLGSIDDSGNSALDNAVLNGKIPGLDKSVNELLGFDSDSSEAASIDVFNLRDAAAVYLNDFSYTTEFPSLSGLVEALNLALSRDLTIPFTTSQTDWSGYDLSGFDFSKLGIDALRNFDFSGANLAGANFRGLDLSGVDFSGA
ncbi:Uncharacterized protein YjbI, contains pentapeptide repeats, partial [Marinobacterium sediminicola]